jgi:hypothetical protein
MRESTAMEPAAKRASVKHRYVERPLIQRLRAATYRWFSPTSKANDPVRRAS